MNFARILRKIGSNFLTDKSISEIRYFQIAVDRVVVGDRDKIHPALAQEPMEIPWVAITVRKVESSKEPFFGTRTETGMNVEIATAHAQETVRYRWRYACRPPSLDRSWASDFRPIDRLTAGLVARFQGDHDRADEC